MCCSHSATRTLPLTSSATLHTAPLCDGLASILTAKQKSTASSPARLSTRARAARTSSVASARFSRSASRPTRSRRRGAVRRIHPCASRRTALASHTRMVTRTTAVRCVDDQIRLSCANVHESCQVSRRPGCHIWSITLFQHLLSVSASIAGAWLCWTSRSRGLCLGFLHVDGSFSFS